MPGKYSWVERVYSGHQVSTVGGENYRFSVHLTLLESGKKIRPYIIVKGAPFPENIHPHRNKISHEIINCQPDNSGNKYPPGYQLVLVCYKSEDSNVKLTVDILQK